MTEQPPSLPRQKRSMFAVGMKESPYSTNHQLPLTLLADRDEAETLRRLLDSSGSKLAYAIEIPLWPDLRDDAP